MHQKFLPNRIHLPKQISVLARNARLIEAEQSESGEESNSGLDVRDGEEFEEGSSQGSGSALEEEEEEDDVDVDAPRVAQWEEDDEGFLGESEAENDRPEEVRIQIISFKKQV